MANETKTLPGSARQAGYAYVAVPGQTNTFFEVAQTRIGNEISDPSVAGRKFKRVDVRRVRSSEKSVSLLP